MTRWRGAALLVIALAGVPGWTTAAAAGDSPPEVVIQVDSHGGFVPVEIVQGNIPEITVYADGRVFVQQEGGSFDRMVRLRVARIDEARLQELVDQARSIGLLDDAAIDYGFPNVTDLTDTTVTITLDGETYGTTVYALDFDAEDLTPEQQANRSALSDFIAEVGDPGPTRRLRPTHLAVLATRALDDRGDKVVEWPLADIASLGDAAQLAERCFVVTGDDLATLLPLAKNARTAHRWDDSGDIDWRLVFRPLLPHERTCADIDAL